LKLAPYDWFQRVLKYYKNKSIVEENTLKSVQRPKKGVLTGFPSRRLSGPAEERLYQQEKNRPVLCGFFLVLDFKLAKLTLSFFIKEGFSKPSIR